MCIVFMSISENPKHDKYKVIIAVNRDEFFDRPTKELDWWDNMPDIISGIDLYPGKEGGTWLGISKTGRIGILTNYRQNPKIFKDQGKEGRGYLVSEYLKSSKNPQEFLEDVKKNGQNYNGFNLIVGDVPCGNSGMNFGYYCNKEHKPLDDLKPGIYGLSNRYLDYGWTKVTLGKERFEKIIKEKSSMEEKIEKMLELLQDKTRHGIDDCPSNDGVEKVMLESLSAISVYVPLGKYGTRTNSIIVVDDEDNVTFIERTMIEPIEDGNEKWKTNKFQFKIEPQLLTAQL